VLLFIVVLNDRRIAPENKLAPYTHEGVPRSFWLNPRENQAFAWAWLSRFVLIMGLALLLTYQAFYLIHGLGRLPRPQKSVGKPW